MLVRLVSILCHNVRDHSKVSMWLIIDPLFTPFRVSRIVIDVVGTVREGLLPFLGIVHYLL